jgi:prevent-host-death family protein
VKTVTVSEFKKKIKACIDDSQDDRVIITRSGKPAAVLYGVEGSDWEAVVRQMDPEFWKLIEERRKQTTISFEEFEKKLGKSR